MSALWQPAAAAMAALITACVPAGPTPAPSTPAPSMPTSPCGAAALQGLVGQPAAALDALQLSQPHRILRPGMPVTMDYNPERLNISVDAGERIERAYCG